MKNINPFLFFLILLIYSLTAESQETEESRKTVRILTYNILHGATTEGNNDLDVVAEVIKSTKPDLVAVQEMDYKTNRVQGRDISTELAVKTGMFSTFAKALDFDGGQYGQSLLSRWRFLRSGKIDLPGAPQKEPRISAVATLMLPGGDTIKFVGTHLDHLPNSLDRRAQAKKINKIFQDSKLPIILAGDLNDVPKSQTIKIFESHWTSTYDKQEPEPTYPSHAPIKKIDYIMYYPSNRWKVLEKKVLCDKVASDHCAYLVVLELLPKQE